MIHSVARLLPGKLRLSSGSRGMLTLILMGTFVLSLTAIETTDGTLRTSGLAALRGMAQSVFSPDLSPRFLGVVLEASWRTVAYATAGMTVAILIGIPGGLLASGVLVRSPATRVGSMTVVRGALGFLRAIHELIWALIFVTAFGLSPLAGALAIGIPYGGIIGRILAERLQDVPDAPLHALRSSGASELQVLIYGRVPAALTDMVSYFFYRFECAVRSAAVLSFVGLGGIGFRISIALDDLRFGQVWTLLFALVLIIIAIDTWSAQVRRRLTR